MTNKRIFVKKRNGYNKEELQLRDNLNLEFNLGLDSVELYVIYDVFNIDEETYELAKTSVFSEIVVDEVFEDIELNDGKYFAYEVLPAQYDQRADSAKESIRLLNSKSKATVRSGKLVLFNKELTDEQLELVESYLVNPIEARKKDLSILDFTLDSTPKPLKDLAGFLEFDKDALLGLKKEFSLAMNIEDLVFIQDYFKKEGRVPTETEIYVLDCYWSDHCRHTTFETVLDEVKIESELFQKEMQDAFDYYLNVRDELDRNDKPITLMDMASIIGKYHVKVLKDENIEVSEEINACSFFTTIENNGEKERWLIQFKNETHNHPSEIEPFGGASTCIGGAIRDPLSGRSYVYQAMRISGSGNVLQKREDTLKHKLPQVDIAKGTAHGNSSYGNQIGLATTFVRELYDDSYVAKHMEVGAVVGAVKDGDYKRETLVDGDIVVMIGGRTGRDGIQGASGSSVEHTNDSLNTMSSQVQKGNAPEERKLQRLFRKPEVTKLIKKCNDFGAGGVCVAIGELSDGIEIHLEKVLTKYQGLNATELATSESQERMAVAIDKKDYEAFVRECEKENIEYAHVANVTNRRRLEMYYNDEKVVDMSADFLETSGVRQKSTVTMKDNTAANPFLNKEVTRENILSELGELNVTCQKGLAQKFDSSIGVTTVLMPFAGKHKLTPVQASVQALPTLHTTSDTATILTYGFIPKISYYSPFLSSIYAVLESVAKVYAVGGNKDSLYFSFQEYFEKLGTDSTKWGKVTQSLLGSIYAQKEIGIDTRILLPAYPKISSGIENTHVVTEFDNFAGHVVLRYGEYNGVGIYLIDAPHLYWREGNPYHDTDYNDYADNYKRFALLGWVGAELSTGLDSWWRADVVHAHDWHAGLAAAYLFNKGRPAKSVFTIHNLAYQGQFAHRHLHEIGLPEGMFHVDGLELFGQISYLKAGLYYSDMVTAVSPTYAKEVYDVTGAGDTVISVFTLAKAAGATWEEAAKIANAAGGIVVGKIGTSTVSEKELIETYNSIYKNN